jgi:hypothetical protein
LEERRIRLVVGRQQAPVQKAQAEPKILWKTKEILTEDKILTR